MYESSPASSEYSTGSTLVPNALCDQTEDFHADICALPQNAGQELQSDRPNDQRCLAEESGIYHGASTDRGVEHFFLQDDKITASVDNTVIYCSRCYVK